MWNWFTFFLIVHILAVLVAFGPSFGYPIIGALIAKHPQHAVFGTEVIETIATRMTVPLAVVVPLSGTGLIYNVHIDLWHSEWLVISIVLYTAMFIYGVFVQTRTGAKLLHVL